MVVQEVVRFNVCLRVLEMQGLPTKYKQYKVTLQRGQKLVTSGDIYADEECNLIRDDGMATTMQFVTSMQRAVSGIDFEVKEYKLKLQRVKSRSYHPSKTVAKTVINIAEACTRDNLELRLEMESELDSSGPCWITISIDANTRKNDGDTASMYNSEASSMAGRKLKNTNSIVSPFVCPQRVSITFLSSGNKASVFNFCYYSRAFIFMSNNKRVT